MARRSDHTRDELKANILQAALDIVDTKGLNKLSARSIADKIGYTVGTLYHVYKNLDDIILHINAQTLEMLEEMMGKQRHKGTQAIALTYISLAKKHPARWHILSGHQVAPLPAWYRKKIEHSFDVAEELLRPDLGNKAGEAVRVLWASIHGIALLSQQGRLKHTSGDATTLISSLVTHYLAGLTSR